MNIFIILAAFVGVAFASPPSEREVHQKWQHFKTTYRKAYENDAEENHRMNIFKENLIKIADHNTRFEKGEVTYRVGVNKHADLRSHEMQAKLSSYRMELKKTSDMVHVSSIEALSSTSSVDWRNEGYVTAVKDQGSCNACWAFSATGALEAQLFKKTSKLVSLSEQNLIDCSSRYGNVGCVGGVMDYAFKYIQDYGGIETEATYPYVSDVTLSIGVCKFNASNSAGTVTGYVDVNPTEKDLEDAVSRIGPVSVGIDSNHWTFKLYSGGIYYEENCSSYTLDHAVLVVGYDTDENGQEYWIVKNSYGEDWGEKGYAKMARNRGNNCGIASLASYPTV